METFETQWKRLLVYAPDCPITLVQEFINTAYSRVLASGQWSGLRGDGEFTLPAPLTITINPTHNSATILSASADAAHVGRQIYVDHAPFYTVLSVSAGVSYTVDRPYAGASGATTGTLEQVYVTVPSDFLTFVSVKDNEENWRLHTGILPETLDNWDEQRTSTGTSWIIAPATRSPVTATIGIPRYEFWPRPAAEKVFSYVYIKKPALLSANSDTLIFPIRGDLIRHGALAELAMWPGLAERPNPYFNMDLARVHEEAFQRDLAAAQREDQEIAQTSVQYADADIPLAPLDGEFLQAHI